MEEDAQRARVSALPPGAALSCCFGRTAQEMMPRDIPDHLVPIVEALLSAQTDEAARRKLGLSPRTFSRRVAELLDHLGVPTRFQGGLELARRGCRDYWRRPEGRPGLRRPSGSRNPPRTQPTGRTRG